MVVKGGEPGLGAVLEDASTVCDELVVVDVSGDGSTRIAAEEHGARVFEFAATGDTADACNFALDHCSNAWILWLETSEHVPHQARAGFDALKRHLSEDPEVGAVRLLVRAAETSPGSGADTAPQGRELTRVVRRGRGVRWSGSGDDIELGLLPGTYVRRPETIVWTDAWIEERPLPRHLRKDAPIPPAPSEDGGQPDPRAHLGGDDELGDSLDLLMHRADALLEEQHFRIALVVFDQFLDETVRLSREHEGDDRTLSAIRSVRYDAFVKMARCCQAIGDDEAKYGYLLRASSLDRSRVDAVVALGVHHFDREEWTTAATYFTAATSHASPQGHTFDTRLSAWVLWEYLARCHAELGLYRQAIVELERSLDGSPHRSESEETLRRYRRQLALQNGTPQHGGS